MLMNTCVPRASGGGHSAVIEPLNINPDVVEQIITATSGVDGYSPITVEAVTSSIDPNILSNNIKNGVTILGVTGSYAPQLTTLNATANGTYRASSQGAEGYSEVVVNVSGGGGSKYGANIDSLLGGVDANGDYQYGSLPQNSTLSFNGIKQISQGYALNAKFVGVSGLVSAVFPDLESVTGASALQACFEYCPDLTDVYFPKLTNIGGNTCLRYMLTGTSATAHYRYEKYGTANFNAQGGAGYVFDLTDLGSLATLPDPSQYSASDIGITCEVSSSYYQLADNGAGTLYWQDITH